MNKSFLLSGLLVSFAAACGGGDSTPDARPITTVDARPDSGGGTVDAPPVSRCNVLTEDFGDVGDFSEFGTAEFVAGEAAATDDFIRLLVGFGEAEPFDFLGLELYAGFASFTNGIMTGSYDIAGDELNYQSCGVCARIYGGVTEANDPPFFDYLATGGTVELTMVPTAVGEMLSVAYSNMTYEHVTIDDTFLSTPVGDGCELTLTSASFTGPVAAPAVNRTAGRAWSSVTPARSLKR